MLQVKTKRKGWVLVAVAAMMISCTEIIELELDSTYTRLVVEGSVTTDSLHHQVRLTTTADYFSNEPVPPVSGALVELTFGDGTLRYEEIDSLPGTYQSPVAFRGVIGNSYRLDISQVDMDGDGDPETYHAESTMPGSARFDSVTLDYFTTFFASGYQVYIYALDPPERNWYNIRFWKNSDMLTDTLIKFNIQPDDLYNGKYLFYGIPIGFYNDEDPREALQPGDTVTVELNSIDEPYYNFILDAQLEIIGNNPLFSGPAANIRSNLDQEARGYFAAYSIVRSSVIVPETP